MAVVRVRPQAALLQNHCLRCFPARVGQRHLHSTTGRRRKLRRMPLQPQPSSLDKCRMDQAAWLQLQRASRRCRWARHPSSLNLRRTSLQPPLRFGQGTKSGTTVLATTTPQWRLQKSQHVQRPPPPPPPMQYRTGCWCRRRTWVATLGAMSASAFAWLQGQQEKIETGVVRMQSGARDGSGGSPADVAHGIAGNIFLRRRLNWIERYAR
mmetsp:Transcript_115782/g.327481  ORF Transcript_115782/g.327481 Transcript_115782/m.327481 type:complete len:210 (+) Transcript_115782:1711-2340(+)